MMMYRKIAIVVCIALFGFSCAKSSLEPTGVENPNDDKVLSFSIEAFKEAEFVSTRVGGEINQYTIHYGYVFFFNSAGDYVGNYFVDKDVDAITDNGGKNPSFLINDPAYSNTHSLYCVFNFDKSNFDDDFSDVTLGNVHTKFPMNSAFLDKVAASHNGEDGAVRYSVGMPMFVDDTKDVNPSTHEIYRAVSRMSIAIASDVVIPHESHSHTVHSTDLSYDIVNSVHQSYMGGDDMYTTAQDAIYDGTSTLTFPHAVRDYVEGADHSQDSKVYLFAFPYSTNAVDGSELDVEMYDSKRLAIIIAHEDEYSGNTLYYKLNLVDKIKNKYFDVEPNHDYRIVIKSIYSRGYESLEEAYLMPPSNIEYEIYDDMGEMTYSNGQYAISMDEILNYDNVQIYGHETTRVTFSNIKYIIPDEMSGIDVNDLTNIVDFEIVGSTDSLSVNTVLNEFDGNEFLTSEPRSIILDVTGQGSCIIKLRIKLGNLDVGRDAITIIKDAKDGALDAHPIQLKLDGIEILPETWNSTDFDFGAWYDADNARTILYMGDNAIPTGYQTMDGYVSSSNAKDSYPIFAEKERTAYYSYIDHNVDSDHTLKTKVMVLQLPPAYLGHFGSQSAMGSHTQYDAVVAERIEEIELREGWEPYKLISKTDGIMMWSTTSDTYYTPSMIYSNGRYINGVDGLGITKYLAETYMGNTTVNPSAATYCYMKNDVNGNGIIEDDEPIEWYLPATNQMLAMWINKTALQEDPLYDLNGGEGDSYPRYWSCSEFNSNTTTPSADFPHAISMNIIEGMFDPKIKNNIYEGAHIRCVRAVNH